MAHSPLCEKVIHSPNYANDRNNPAGRNPQGIIDCIAIHCMAGNLTIETCGNVFAPVARQASSHYGVGSDGRIACYVEEEYRSWCTGGNKRSNGWSGWEIDHRAITIEVANDGGAPDWHVSDAALISLINLCADICKRNNIKQLKWENNPNIVGDFNRQNIMVHRWFDAKACPGDYLMSQMSFIATEVNKKLSNSPTTTLMSQVYPQMTVGNHVRKTGKVETEGTIWQYLTSLGMTSQGAAGMMGNLFAESGLRPDNLQNSYEKYYGSDSEYTAKLNNRSYSEDQFATDKAGYGLAQWTWHSRKRNLYKATINNGYPIDSLTRQCVFLVWELQHQYRSVWNVLTDPNATLAQCSETVLKQFEKPKDQSQNVVSRRLTYSQDYFIIYGNGKPASNPSQLYRVRRTWQDAKSQVGAFKVLENAKKLADANNLSVFDEAGNKVYP